MPHSGWRAAFGFGHEIAVDRNMPASGEAGRDLVRAGLSKTRTRTTLMA
ncbi:MAG: hypothetical protein WCC44_06675 [Azonexus sp.]